MCCFIGAVLAGGRRMRLPPARVAAITAGLALAVALAAWHLPHYLSRAEANDRTVLAEILAEPLCIAPAARAESAR